MTIGTATGVGMTTPTGRTTTGNMQVRTATDTPMGRATMAIQGPSIMVRATINMAHLMAPTTAAPTLDIRTLGPTAVRSALDLFALAGGRSRHKLVGSLPGDLIYARS